jgi:hypothetical protein
MKRSQLSLVSVIVIVAGSGVLAWATVSGVFDRAARADPALDAVSARQTSSSPSRASEQAIDVESPILQSASPPILEHPRVDRLESSGFPVWWRELPRQPEGWFFGQAIMHWQVLADAEQYVRCEDLNPTDTPVDRSTYDEFRRLAKDLGDSIRTVASERDRLVHEELEELVRQGQVPESTREGLADAAAYQRELRIAQAAQLARQESDNDPGKAERLAMINTLGHSRTGGVVRVQPDGKMYAANIDRDLPQTAIVAAKLRQETADLALLIVGFAVEAGLVGAGEGVEAAAFIYRQHRIK